MNGTVTKCNKKAVGKLIVCVEANSEDFVNEVKVLAKRTDVETEDLVELETARIKKHPNYLLSKKMIDGIARTKVPIGTYTVCLKGQTSVEEEDIVVKKKSKNNRRNPHARLTIPLTKVEIKSIDESARATISNVEFKFRYNGNENPYAGEKEDDFAMNINLPAWGEIIGIEAEEQLEFVNVEPAE